MDVKESYRILRLKPGADLDEIKASYRRLAFKLHPDLNQDNPNAAKDFQRLNEAYVILKEAVQGETRYESPRARKAKEKARESASRAGQRQGPPGGAANQSRTGAASGGSSGGSAPGGATTGSSPGASKDTGPPPGGRAAGAKASQRTRPGSASTPPPGSGSASARNASSAGAGTAGPGRTKSRPKRDVIKNIMNDPFARKVFDEIYSHIRTGDTKPKGKVKKRQLSLNWGDKQFKLDVSRGVFSGMRGWFRRQFDDEQTVYLTPSQLMPGSRLKLNIRRAWTGKPVTVELPLPRDYVVGRPIRLKGLGRQFGPFKGDLYLRLLAK